MHKPSQTRNYIFILVQSTLPQDHKEQILNINFLDYISSLTILDVRLSFTLLNENSLIFSTCEEFFFNITLFYLLRNFCII